MRKNATKIAAMMLSLALTVTSVNVPTTASAAAKVTLNKTKATLYVGGASSKKTTTLKATLNGKKVKATFTSNKSKVAKVAKSTGKVTAVKKGTATITAKYSGKKATCKVTVKQYVTSITAPATIELKEGEIVDLSKQVTVSPANANNKELSYVPDESYVAGVNKDGTVLKGVQAGQTVVTIKAKDGSGKKTTVVVNVKAADAPTPSDEPGTSETPAPSNDKEAAAVRLGLENPFSTDYANTVMVGTNAFVKVQLVDENDAPVANKEVELTAKRLYPTLAAANSDIAKFGCVSEAVKKTDSKGYVTFVYGLNTNTDSAGKQIDATSDNFVSSFRLTATSVDNTSIKGSMDVKFAALTTDAPTAAVSVRNSAQYEPWNYPDLVPGINAVAKYGIHSYVLTKGRNNEDIHYVTSQQVSRDGKDDHKVTFNSGLGAWQLKIPNDESDSSIEAERIKEEINWSTDKYLTYSGEQKNTSNGWVLKGVKASELQYATVRFSKLRLSKYSRFLVRAWIVADPSNPTADWPAPTEILTLKESESDVSGPKAEDNFSVQIPVNAKSGYLYVTAQIISAGQVNTDLNEGFTVNNIEAVKKPGALTSVSPDWKGVQGLEVNWSIDDEVTYTIEQKFDSSSTGVLGAIYGVLTSAPYNYTNKNQYTYKTPAFPATGNAIITVRDEAGKVVAYFAAPTENRENTITPNTYDNINVLTGNAASKMYQISEDEATHINIGEVSQNGNDLIVDSKKSGITHVVGKIVSNGVIKLNEANSRIYTSVHWNPVANETVNSAGIAAAAFVGQNLVLRAQLVDKNGNPVTTSNNPVQFHQTNDAHVIAKGEKLGNASVINVDEKTNPKGQAELILNSGNIAEVLKIYATSSSSSYDIKYYLGTELVEAPWVDLYWVDANLYFEPTAPGGSKTETSGATPVQKVMGIEPKVGEHWAYEVRVSGDATVTGGSSIADFSGDVDVSGLTVQTSKDSGSVGEVTNMSNGKAEATSTKAGLTHIVNVLNSSSIGNDVKFIFYKPGRSGSTEVRYAGEGTATLNKKLTLDVDWGHTAPTVNFIIPTGRRADIAGGTVNVYVEVKDGHGNPIENSVVTLEVTGVGSATFDGAAGTANGNDGTLAANPKVKTNEYGIAGFTIDPDVANSNTLTASADTTSQLTAKVEGLNDLITQSSITWINVTGGILEAKSVQYDPNAKTLTLTFDKNVSAESVQPGIFTVKYAASGNTADFKSQIVTDVKVSGKEVVISVPYLSTTGLEEPSIFEIEMRPYTDTKTQITYSLVSTDANELSLTAGVYSPGTFTAGDAIKKKTF